MAASEGVCKNVPVGLHYEIVYANVGALGNPQAKIIGVMMQFQYDDIHFLVRVAYRTYLPLIASSNSFSS